MSVSIKTIMKTRGIGIAVQRAIPKRVFPGSVVDPEAYCLSIGGDCLEPHVFADDLAIISPGTRCDLGGLIVLWPIIGPPLLKYLVAESQDQLIVKMLNPWKQFIVRRAQLQAVHAVLGIARPTEYSFWPTIQPEESTG